MLDAKKQCAAMQPKTLGDEAACRARAEEVRAASITAVHLPPGRHARPGDNPVLGCADYSPPFLQRRIQRRLHFSRRNAPPCGQGTALVTDKDPGDAEIAEVVSQAAAHSCIKRAPTTVMSCKAQLRLAKGPGRHRACR